MRGQGITSSEGAKASFQAPPTMSEPEDKTSNTCPFLFDPLHTRTWETLQLLRLVIQIEDSKPPSDSRLLP